jgi:hypothetical protein
MLAIIKAPGAPAQRYDLPEGSRAQLAAMQSVVGGYIEIAVRGRDFLVWCNEEGKIQNPPLRHNFFRPQDLDAIVGTVLVTGPARMSLDGGIPTALTEESYARVATLIESWCEAGIRCGTMPEHYDPDTVDEKRAAVERAARRIDELQYLAGGLKVRQP